MDSTSTTQSETTVGNYFISNYPPYAFWKPEHAGEAYAAISRLPRGKVPLGLYLHIPFCRKRCHFCYFRVYSFGMNIGHGYIFGCVDNF